MEAREKKTGREITKIVLLTDDKTSVTGRYFMDTLASVFEAMGKQAARLDAGMDKGVAEAVQQFDEISRIRPDLLIVADFACIRMQSAEEEPMYNNNGIPTIHLLFCRPWEYEIFMTFRCDFPTRVYCLLAEDIPYIKSFYPYLLNVYAMAERILDRSAGEVCYAAKGSAGELQNQYDKMPEYMKTLGHFYEQIKEKTPQMPDSLAVQECLKAIQFTCNVSEYMDILYMMQNVFALWYLRCLSKTAYEMPQIRTEALHRQAETFLDMDYPITLLTS